MRPLTTRLTKGQHRAVTFRAVGPFPLVRFMDARPFSADAGSPHLRPKAPALIAATALLAAFAAFPSAPLSIAQVWIESSTYHHAALAAPIGMSLIWRERRRFARARPSWRAAALVAALAGLWLVAHAAAAQIGEHVTFALLLIACWVSVYGWLNARRAAGGFFVCLFAVPFGAGLAPLLQSLSTHFVSLMLPAAGVAVARDGAVLTTSEGRFVIADACAGLNFLLAAGLVAAIFSAVALPAWRARAQFFAAALVAAFYANILRAFLVIWLAVKTPLGLDFARNHALFGWGLYAIFLLLLIEVGRRLRTEAPPDGETPRHARESRVDLRPAALSISVIALVGVYAALVVDRAPAPGPTRIPAPGASWTQIGDGLFSDGAAQIVLRYAPASAASAAGVTVSTAPVALDAASPAAGAVRVTRRLSANGGASASVTFYLVGDRIEFSRARYAAAVALARLHGAALDGGAYEVSTNGDSAALLRFIRTLTIRPAGAR